MLCEELWDCDVLAQIQQEKKKLAVYPTSFPTRNRKEQIKEIEETGSNFACQNNHWFQIALSFMCTKLQLSYLSFFSY